MVQRNKAEVVCARCQRVRPHTGRNLCAGCYTAARLAGTLLDWPTWATGRTCPSCGDPLTSTGARATYCSSRCKQRHATATGRGYTYRLPAGRHCQWCDRPLSGQQRKYCNATCKDAQRTAEKIARRLATALTCRYCGGAYFPGKTTALKYCSEYCRNKRNSVANATTRKACSSNWSHRRRQTLRRGHDVSARDWRRLVNRYRGACAYCGAVRRLTRDHVVPLSRGGLHSIGNLLPACVPCNSRKGSKLLVEWPGRKKG